MKRLGYEFKIYFSSPVVVFFTLIFPLVLIMFVNTATKNIQIKEPVIGVNEQMQQFIPDGKLVKNYQDALQNKEIDFYVSDKIVVLDKKANFANPFKIEIESKLQGVSKSYSQLQNTSQQSYFIPILTMQALYIVFIAVILFNRYYVHSPVGQRILVSGVNRIKEYMITALATILIHSFAISFVILYMIFENILQFNLYQLAIIWLLMLVGLGIGFIVVQIPKLKQDTKAGVAVWIAQTFTLLGGGFGLNFLQYHLGTSSLRYFSPVLLTNSLITYQFQILDVIALIVTIIVFMMIGWWIGGKNDHI